MNRNDYVRTKDGYICKYTQDNNVLGIETIGNDRYYLIRKSETFKSSPNIIDLIEVGDYVNGLKVDKKYEDRVVINTRDEIIVWFEYQIKSIVTKEQFERCEYRIGEDNDSKRNV